MNKKEKEIKQVLEKMKEKDLKTMGKFKEKNNNYYQLDGKSEEKNNLNQISSWSVRKYIGVSSYLMT